jgi:hypothetical protein
MVRGMLLEAAVTVPILQQVDLLLQGHALPKLSFTIVAAGELTAKLV